ncbi:hypothetical protein V2W45_731105 [Cenococcum geophilum]
MYKTVVLTIFLLLKSERALVADYLTGFATSRATERTVSFHMYQLENFAEALSWYTYAIIAERYDKVKRLWLV